MSFATVINCMDGRIQEPVITFLKNRFNVAYIDSITEPGPNLILAQNTDTSLINSITDRLTISVEKHSSVGLAIVGHHDCAGNTAPKNEQIQHISEAIQHIHQKYPTLEIIGLWVDENWIVHEVSGLMEM